jgi:hypothetical protein
MKAGKEESRNAFRILVGKRRLGRPRRRLVFNINMGLMEICYEDGRRMELAQDRVELLE